MNPTPVLYKKGGRPCNPFCLDHQGGKLDHNGVPGARLVPDPEAEPFHWSFEYTEAAA